MKKVIILGIFVLAVWGIWSASKTTSPIIKNEGKVIDADLVVTGDYAVLADEKLTFKNKAKLVVKGSLSVDGELATTDGNDLLIAVEGTITFSKDSKVASSGGVQLVRIINGEYLMLDDKRLEGLFQEIGEDSGGGPRIGPLINGGLRRVDIEPTTYLFTKTAHAQDVPPRDNLGNAVDNVIISGTWRVGDGGPLPGGLAIPEPPLGVRKIVLNFDLGPGANVTLQDFYLAGPDGREGKSSIGESCVVSGRKGEDAFRLRVQGADINLNNFTLELGDGGVGGAAETKADCDPGVATGGAGGSAGNFKMMATGEINIASFHIIPGRGGNGGEAIAYGKDGAAGCPGKKGGDATATAGEGGENKKELAALGAVTGIGNVQIDPIVGGDGGDARATGGKGGDGTVCGAGPQGGDGGPGGKAKSVAGKGGLGTNGNGEDGEVKDETGGNGGNGADGCGPGKGGKGGSGNPVGTDGTGGKNTCSQNNTQTGTTGGNTGTSVTKIKVINYNGKYLPVDQLIIENEAGCGADHWHAAEGVVKATDGTMVPDPGPQCGYGKKSEKPIIEVDS